MDFLLRQMICLYHLEDEFKLKQAIVFSYFLFCFFIRDGRKIITSVEIFQVLMVRNKIIDLLRNIPFSQKNVLGCRSHPLFVLIFFL